MATSCRGPVWVDHVQAGAMYAIGHLSPVFTEYLVPALPAKGGKPGRGVMNARLHVSYSHHCFTRGSEPNDDPDHSYTCTARHETRTFCGHRWEESKSLPTILGSLNTCYFTRHHNFFVWRDPVNPALGEYFVYFTVQPHSSGQFLELFVESAYPRTDSERAKKGAGKVGFNVLVVNALRGVRTRAP